MVSKNPLRALKDKLDLKNRIKSVFTDLFMFKSKALNPAVTDVLQKFNAAAKVEAPADRMEQLLAVRQEADAHFYKISGRQTDKGIPGMLTMFAGMCLLMTATAGATIAIAGAIAIPAGIGLLAAGAAYIGKVLLNGSAANADREALSSKINTAVKKLAKESPGEAIKSPRFQEAIRDSFNSSLYQNETFKDLTRRVAPKDDYREDYSAFDRHPGTAVNNAATPEKAPAVAEQTPAALPAPTVAISPAPAPAAAPTQAVTTPEPAAPVKAAEAAKAEILATPAAAPASSTPVAPQVPAPHACSDCGKPGHTVMKP